MGYHTFHENQFGFRQGRSTTDALKKVQTFIGDNIRNSKYSFMTSLDIGNAFNTIRWESINQALERRGIPRSIINLMNNYFEDRKIEYTTDNYKITKFMQMGCLKAPF